MRKVLNGTFFLLAAAGVLGIVFLWIPELFGITPRVVMSGSMEPEIRVGSLVYISRQIPPEKIREQDIISYQLGEKMEVLHRVIVKNPKEKVFRTKGDANVYADLGEVKYSDYRGKAVGVIPWLGYLVFYLQQGMMPVWLFFGIGGLVVADWLLDENMERRRVGEENISSDQCAASGNDTAVSRKTDPGRRSILHRRTRRTDG